MAVFSSGSVTHTSNRIVVSIRSKGMVLGQRNGKRRFEMPNPNQDFPTDDELEGLERMIKGE
jgi:hypothetical protein